MEPVFKLETLVILIKDGEETELPLPSEGVFTIYVKSLEPKGPCAVFSVSGCSDNGWNTSIMSSSSGGGLKILQCVSEGKLLLSLISCFLGNFTKESEKKEMVCSDACISRELTFKVVITGLF
jgi:hypothetical protein